MEFSEMIENRFGTGFFAGTEIYRILDIIIG